MSQLVLMGAETPVDPCRHKAQPFCKPPHAEPDTTSTMLFLLASPKHTGLCGELHMLLPTRCAAYMMGLMRLR